jgi:hypothetical protein
MISIGVFFLNIFRLRGNYEALDGGRIQDAIVDLTGAISEYIDLSDKSNIPNNLYDLIRKSYQMNSLMGASIHVKLLFKPVEHHQVWKQYIMLECHI